MKKIILGLTSMVVVSAIAIGGTLAFMTHQTQKMTNTFTAAEGLTGQIREPLWDGYQFDTTGTDAKPDGLSANPSITDSAAKEALGITMAGKMTPGLSIPKNPTLMNTSKVPVFMAIKVTYKDKNDNDTKAKFEKIASFAVNSGWTESSAGSGIYYYTGTNSDGKLAEVAPNTATATALFSSVLINSAASSDDLTNNQFAINVIGSAVQTTNILDADAKAELVKTLGVA